MALMAAACSGGTDGDAGLPSSTAAARTTTTDRRTVAEAVTPTTASTPPSEAASAPPPTTTPPRARSVGRLAARGDHVLAYTGSETLVWGGVSRDPRSGDVVRAFADGARYRHSDSTWRPMAPAPLSPRWGAVTAWTGRSLLIWGGYTATSGPPGEAEPVRDGAIYDPARDRWTRLPDAPLALPMDGVAAVWSDGRFLVCASHLCQVWSEADDTWREAPPPPDEMPVAQAYAVPAGTDQIVFPSHRAGRLGRNYLAALVLHLDSLRWERLPLSTNQEHAMWIDAVPLAGCRVMFVYGEVYGYPSANGLSTRADVLDVCQRRWSRAPDAPDRVYVQLIPWARGAIGWGGTSTGKYPGSVEVGVVYDDPAATWRRIPKSPLGTREAPGAWTGDGLLVWGGRTATYPPGSGADHIDGALYDPDSDGWSTLPPAQW